MGILRPPVTSTGMGRTMTHLGDPALEAQGRYRNAKPGNTGEPAAGGCRPGCGPLRRSCRRPDYPSCGYRLSRMASRSQPTLSVTMRSSSLPGGSVASSTHIRPAGGPQFAEQVRGRRPVPR